MISVWCDGCGARHDVKESDMHTRLCGRCRNEEHGTVYGFPLLTQAEFATRFEVEVTMRGSYIVTREDVASDAKWRDLLDAYASNSYVQQEQAFDPWIDRASDDALGSVDDSSIRKLAPPVNLADKRNGGLLG